MLTVPKSIAKSAENKLNNGRRLLRETRVNQSKRIMPTARLQRRASCRAGQEDGLVARYGAPLVPMMDRDLSSVQKRCWPRLHN